MIALGIYLKGIPGVNSGIHSFFGCMCSNVLQVWSVGVRCTHSPCYHLCVGMPGRLSGTVGTPRAWVLCSVKQCPGVGRVSASLPPWLSVQSRTRCLPAAAAMRTQGALQGLAAGAGVPLLQETGMLPAQVLLSPAWMPILGFEHLLKYPG